MDSIDEDISSGDNNRRSTQPRDEGSIYDKTSEAMNFISICQCSFFCFFCYLLICDWSRGQNRPFDQSQFSKHQNKFIED